MSDTTMVLVAPTEKPSAEEAYRSVEQLLYKLALNHRRVHPRTPWDEVISTVNFAFTQAFHNWNPTRSKLTTWVTWVVTCTLKETAREAAQRKERLPTITNYCKNFQDVDGRGLETVPDRRRTFDLDLLLEGEPERLRTVIDLVLDPPPDVVLRSRLSRRKYPDSLREAVIEWLSDIGWSLEEVTEAFQQVRDLLH